MTLRIVRLGSERHKEEGLRIGAVRRPPRGVRKEDYGRENWFDIWYPDLSPSPELMGEGRASESDKDWRNFIRRFRAEMNEPAPRRLLDLLALLSQEANFSLGCYCEEEGRCHRSVLRALLSERGARFG